MKESQIRKQNMKIYTLYRMLSIDHIFYYAVEFMFMTQVKHISAADIVLGSSAYGFFMIMLQIPAVLVVDKLGNKKAAAISNVFLSLFVLLIMNCHNLGTLFLAQLMDAIGFSLKETSDTSLLSISIPESSKRSEIFSKLEGKGLKNYYYFAAISSVLAGVLYEINPYIPMILSFTLSLSASIIALGFEEIIEENATEDKKVGKITTYIKELKDSFVFIFHSNRLKALLLYSGIVWSIFCLMSTYTTSLLQDIGVMASMIAIVSAIKEISSGIGANYQVQFHKKFRNKALTVMSLIILICIWLTGLVGILPFTLKIAFVFITILAIIINIVKGIHGVLVARYLQNFTDETILSKIYAVNSMAKNVFRVMIGCIGSYLLRVTNTANAIILLAIIFTFIVLFLIYYMKTRLGLKPNEYPAEEVKYDQIINIK